MRVNVSVVSVVLLCFRFSLLAIANLKLYLTLIPPLTKPDMTNMFLSKLSKLTAYSSKNNFLLCTLIQKIFQNTKTKLMIF